MLSSDRYGYNGEDIMVLLDDGKHDAPTRENIVCVITIFANALLIHIEQLHGMAWLVEGAKAGDNLLFHCWFIAPK